MKERLDGLRTRMAAAGMDAALVLHPRDLLYYAGTVRPGSLLVTSHAAVLFVRRGIELARQEATVARVEPGGRFADTAAILAELGVASGTLGTELDLIPMCTCEQLARAFPSFRLADLSPFVLDQRAVKSAAEVELIRAAARIADAGHHTARRAVTAGKTELQLLAEIEAEIRRRGNEGPMPLRAPGVGLGTVLVMSGENLTVRGGYGLVVTGAGLSPATPYGASRRILQEGDLVVVDMAPLYQGYLADQSRTYVVGKATEAQRALFGVTLAVQQAVLSVMQPGATPGQVYAVAEEVVRQAHPPFAAGELTLPGFVGHGVGLEIDEPPVLWPREDMALRAGMTLALEIEVSAPGLGMAKLEDTVLITDDGPELLTAAPRELMGSTD